MPPSLTLKQRLSALSNAQSVPPVGSPTPNPNSNSSYPHTSRSNTADSYPRREPVHRSSTSSFSSSPSTRKLKAFASNLHAPSWMTLKKSGFHGQERGQYAFVISREEEEHQNRLVQEVLGNLIFQAGVDYEYVVLESCSLSLTPPFGFFVKDSTHVSRLPRVFRISVHSRTFHDQGRYERLRLSRSSSSFIRPSTLVRHIILPGGINVFTHPPVSFGLSHPYRRILSYLNLYGEPFHLHVLWLILMNDP